MTTYKRRQKLPKPSLQLKMVGAFVGLAALAMMLQFLFLGSRLMTAVSGLDGAGGELAAGLPGLLLNVLLLSLGACLPIIFGLGILLTFRVAGPIYRFEKYLKSVADGEQSQPCRIRQGDQLQPLCDVINRVTEPLRAKIREEEATSDDDTQVFPPRRVA